jgi:IstB-like ATP binding protein
MTVKTPAPPPLPAELERLLHRLRLPYVRRAAPDVIATATSQRWDHAEVLKVLLAEEAAGRDQATIRTRRRASGLPAGKTLDAWEPERSVIPTQTQQALRTLEWIDRHEVLCVCGPSDPVSHCPPRRRHCSISPRVSSETLILRPFRRPLTTWTACSSPRWTLCKTV